MSWTTFFTVRSEKHRTWAISRVSEPSASDSGAARLALGEAVVASDPFLAGMGQRPHQQARRSGGRAGRDRTDRAHQGLHGEVEAGEEGPHPRFQQPARVLLAFGLHERDKTEVPGFGEADRGGSIVDGVHWKTRIEVPANGVGCSMLLSPVMMKPSAASETASPRAKNRTGVVDPEADRRGGGGRHNS